MVHPLLRANPMFRGLTDTEIEASLAALQAHEQQVSRGTILLSAGDTTQQMGIVLSGSVTIESTDLWGNCTILSMVQRGQVFAESFALLKETLLVDVKANEDSRVLFLRVGILQDLPSAPWKEKLLENLLQICARKNLGLSERSFHTSPKSCRGRLLAYLHSVSLEKHSPSFDIPFDRQQLADYLNLERTSLSRELTRMQQDGILTCRKNHFTLHGNASG